MKAKGNEQSIENRARQKNEMPRDIVLTSDFIRVRHIMLNADLDRLKVISSESVCQGGQCKSRFSNVVPWWPYLNSNEAEIIL
jgi:hypothetical protein